jgi:acetolactate synthase-1/2/3 large subunit
VTKMNGAEALIRSLAASGVDVCFSNPGTSEMHFVAALDKVDGMRAVLALFEGVVTGAADGYARMSGRPAATLLHLGAGLANGLANLHNARRAAVPIVNIVGDHATYHAQYDSPLSADIVDFARPVSAWIHTCQSAGTVGADAARAVQAARAAPGRIATLIMPADTAWNDAEGVAEPLPIARPAPVSEAAINAAVRAFTSGRKAAILIRGAALQRDALACAGRIAAATGCRLFCDTFAPRIDRGAGIVAVERIPYFAEQIAEFLKDLSHLVLVGAKAPVAFFAYPGKPSWCMPQDCKITYLAQEHEDGPAALEALAELFGKSFDPAHVAKAKRSDRPTGKFNAYTIGHAIAHLLPEGAILSDDGATSSGGVLAATGGAPPHTHLALAGGAIGQGLPLAVGAAVAMPFRKVVCLSGDGSGMYTLQALWTMARERLDVTTVVYSNRSYKILNLELDRVGAAPPGPKALSMLDLSNPELNWSGLAIAMGVESSRANTIETFSEQFADAMKSSGPRLIEAVI